MSIYILFPILFPWTILAHSTQEQQHITYPQHLETLPYEQCLTIQGDQVACETQGPQGTERDPMLRRMPGYDFDAYVRADVATFYQKEPGTMTESDHNFLGQGAHFVNMSPSTVSVYWIGTSAPLLIRQLDPWETASIAASRGHKFALTRPNEPDRVLAECILVPETSLYVYDPFVGSNDTEMLDYPSRMTIPTDHPFVNLESLSPKERELYHLHIANHQFARDYRKFTGGSEWLAKYPRKQKPLHFIHRADYFGQTHNISTLNHHFHSLPEELLTTQVPQNQEGLRNFVLKPVLSPYQHSGMLNLTLKVVSCAPRVFTIDDFLSSVEVDHVLDLVQKQTLARSATGTDSKGRVSDTRTSRQTWLHRHDDAILDVIMRRMADVLRIDEALLRNRAPTEPISSVYKHTLPIHESLQVVHYAPGQQYTPHHDYVPPSINDPEHAARSINFCLYLNNVPKGGETAFPRFRNAHTREGLRMKPERGKAMIFYMQTPDGNFDDLTHHAGLPVVDGEKYFTNLWIWEPKRT